MNKRVMRQVVPILLAAGLLWYVLNDVPMAQIGSQFKKADYGLLGLVGVLIGLFYVLRAARWQLTLQAIGYQPSLFRSTVALLAGSLASMIVPGAGELTRCGTLQQTDGIPVSQGLGSVVAERIIDLFMLVFVLLLTVLLEFGRAKAYFANLTLALPGTVILVVGLIVALLATVIIWRLIRHPTAQNHPLVLKAINLIRGFGRGFMAIRQLPRPGLFVSITLLIQIFAWLTTYVLLLATDSTQHLPLTAALTILAVSSLGGLAVPTQGGIGTYHFLVSRALVLYGFSTADGVSLATFMHAVGFGFNLLFSSLSFLIVPVLVQQRKQLDQLPKEG